MGVSETISADMKTEAITAFAEQNAGWTTEVASGYDPTMDISTGQQADIAQFLGRPVRVADLDWAVNNPLFSQFNPWSQWLNDDRVREKLAHYELLRCRLHLKAVISGTGFHYGRAIVSYNPYSGYDDITVTRAFLDVDIVQASQKPKIFLNPTTNMGGEMILPFFFHKNYMSLTASDVDDLGTISVKSINDLLHANGGDDPVNITIYAWAEDVTLTMPTSQYSAQSGKVSGSSGKALNRGDEYGKGIISAPASAIAHTAGHLAEAPIIGPFARATQLCAQATGEVASLFGYSRPSVITDPILVKPHITGNLANTDAAEAVAKLSLDSKQETTIDSRTVGLAGDDQMTLKSLVTRESYLTNFTMTPSNTSDTMLWNCRVGPMLYRVLNEEIHPTPMAMVSNLFERWQGTIKFRFQVVKSAFHKGKILVRWDPRAHGAVEYNTAYSRVIDLAEEDDFEIEIGWGQAFPFAKVDPMSSSVTTPWSSVSRFTADNSELWNGLLEINVVNPLVSPAADANIAFNVFVSAGEDLKLGAPTQDNIKNLSVFPAVTPQSGYVPQSGAMGDMEMSSNTDKPSETSAIAPIAPMSTTRDQQYEVFFGEAPTSLRELLRRYVQTKTYAIGFPGNGNYKIVRLQQKALCPFYGYDTNGQDTILTTPCTIAGVTPLSYMMTCYAGWKGGLRRKYMLEGNQTRNPLISRMDFAPNAISESIISDSNANVSNWNTRIYAETGFNGSKTTDLVNNNCVEVEVPYYNGVRFSTCRLPSDDFRNGAHSVRLTTNVEDSAATTAAGRRALIQQYDAVGEDFTLFFFVGCPILYEYAIENDF